MEFTEYWAPDNSHRYGYWVARKVARKLPEVMDGSCVVNHADAGGPCEREIAYEVLGMEFCEVHGLEANAGVLAQLYHEAMDDFDRMDNPHAVPPQPEVLRVIRENIVRARELHSHHSKLHDQLVGDTFPLIRERVDSETLEWEPGSMGDAPVDFWNLSYAEICGLMLKARVGQSPWLVRELESYREQAAAQLAFAEIVCQEKIDAHKPARAR